MRLVSNRTVVLAASLALATTALAVAAQADERDLVLGRRLTLASKVLGEERAYWVHLPPGYEGGTQRYPVVYLTDAEAQFDHTAATALFLARSARVPQLIVVGVGNTDRTRDLTPTRASITRPDGSVVELPTSGGAHHFLDFFERELIPEVEKSYRTQPYRVFLGHSLGGLFGVHAFLSRPALFGAVVAVSPSLHWDNQLALRQAREFFAGRSQLSKTLVVTLGKEDERMQSGYDGLGQVLASTQARGFEWTLRQFPDDDHNSVVLPSHDFGLRRIFDSWRPPHDPETGEVRASVAELETHYRGVSQRFGFDVHPPENIVNQMGYAALGRKQPEHALAYFELNTRHFPDSANVYDSLGEGLEAAGRLDDARQSYERAVTRGEQAKDPNVRFFRDHLDAVRKKLAAPKP